MKADWSKTWKSSKQPRKQRKYRYNAPLHIRHKMIAANLSKELRKKYGRRNFPLRKGDKVKIMRGQFKGKTGKIEEINLKKLKVVVEGIFRNKKDGSKVRVYLDPSNLQIQELNLDDKERIKALKRKSEKSKEEKKNASEKK